MKNCLLFFLSIAKLIANVNAFAPGNVFGDQRYGPISPALRTQGFQSIFSQQPIIVQRQRKSVASIQTMGLFGLGAPEIAIILIAGAFVLGPQKLAELGKEAGKMAGELKEVPKEFQEGLAEGEKQAKRMKKEIAESSSAVKDAEKE